MNERFQKIYKLDDDLYISNSPVILSAGVLLKDKKTGNMIVQLKFHNVSFKIIKGLKLSIQTFDVFESKLEKIVEYQYLDLCVQNGEYFGFDKAIIMPNKVVRSFKIQCIAVIFADGVCQEILGTDLKALPPQQKLNEVLNSEQLVKQYQITSATHGTYVPREIYNLWQCACGELNNEFICTECGIGKERVFETYNLNLLERLLQVRLDKEQREQLIAEEIACKKTAKTDIGEQIASILFAVFICIFVYLLIATF